MRLGLGNESAQSEAGPLPRIVLVDANIFFAPRLRDLFMHLHEAEALSIHWTREIEGEWTRNVVVKQGADPEDLQRCLRGMRDAAEDWEVSGYTKYTDRFESVDAKDRHVATCQCCLTSPCHVCVHTLAKPSLPKTFTQ